MAKKKKEKKPNLMLEATKTFTKNSAIDVCTTLENKTFEEILNGAYIHISKGEMANLIKRFEKQLLLSKLDEQRFKSGLHTFFTETNKYIKENKLYKEFYYMILIINIELSIKREIDTEVKSAFLSLLMQQASYFKGCNVAIYGINTNGDVLYTNEPIRDYYKISYELSKFKDASMVKSIFNKYGYKNSSQDLINIMYVDKVHNAVYFQMAYFINEDNEKYLKVKYPNPLSKYKCIRFTNRYLINFNVRKKLKNRRKFLPSGGIEVRIDYCEDIVGVYLTEVLLPTDEIVLVFSVKYYDGCGINGFYIPSNCGYYDYWLSANECNQDSLAMSLMTQSLICQLYMDLTCSFDSEEEKKEYILFKNDYYYDEFTRQMEKAPEVRYVINHDYRIVSSHSRDFVRANYDVALADVQPFLRKLPMGASPSEEAVEFATRLGINLPVGYTCVKGFRKKVYINKNKE